MSQQVCSARSSLEIKKFTAYGTEQQLLFPFPLLNQTMVMTLLR
jgi:hypothetical protein